MLHNKLLNFTECHLHEIVRLSVTVVLNVFVAFQYLSTLNLLETTMLAPRVSLFPLSH